MSLFGIDFGTTNTSAFDALTGRAYGDGFGSPLPSIVAIDRASDTPLIGRDAGGRCNWRIGRRCMWVRCPRRRGRGGGRLWRVWSGVTWSLRVRQILCPSDVLSAILGTGASVAPPSFHAFLVLRDRFVDDRGGKILPDCNLLKDIGLLGAALRRRCLLLYNLNGALAFFRIESADDCDGAG